MKPALSASETITLPEIDLESVQDEDLLSDKPWNVVLLDDDFHTYDYVVEMLMAIFGYPIRRAFKMTVEVDTRKRVIVWTGHLERAEAYREQIHAYGADWRMETSKAPCRRCWKKRYETSHSAAVRRVGSSWVRAAILPKMGYDSIIAAGKFVVPDERSSVETLSPEENLRRQRLAVARNAPALKLLREALQQSVETPLSESNSLEPDFSHHRVFRELAVQLKQESEVRFADGDFAGALDSRLTAIELGAVLTRRASYIQASVGFAIESIARVGIEKIASKLDAAQIRAALARLKGIDERRAPYLEILKIEKREVINGHTAGLEVGKKRLATPQGRRESGLSEEEARQEMALTPEVLATDLARTFDALIKREQLPYTQALKVALPAPQTRTSILTLDFWLVFPRSIYESNSTQNRFLQAALELRAIKLETGAYPATFTAPIDPFSDNQPLIYTREGDTFRLYSIGPDGKDDGGSEIQKAGSDDKTGFARIAGRVWHDSLGDIVAPVF
jgi:ATP-dependent Clp protease adaptor protein ClpS